MGAPKRSYPPRLREQQAKEQEKVVRKKRRAYYILIPLLLLITLPLLYGLFERNVLQTKIDSSVERSDLLVRPGEHIQVDVRNACGVDGVAKKFALFLRARKFDVPEYGNAEGKEPYTLVIDRVGDTMSVRKLVYALGISSDYVVTDIDSSLFVQATIVIGTDYKKLHPMK